MKGRQWFKTTDYDQRTAGYEWYPSRDGITYGPLVFMSRETPYDTWGPPRVIVRDVAVTVARSIATSEGFDVEVEL